MSHQNEEEMHPLTVKSLRGVVNTHNQDSHRHAGHQEDEKEKDDWEEMHKDAMIDTRESSSVVSNDEAEEEDDDDDDCLFNLEM
jgi:hypothetical protein